MRPRIPIARMVPRVLAVSSALGERVRRMLAGVAVIVATAAMVVGLGLLAGVAGGARLADGPQAPGGSVVAAAGVAGAATRALIVTVGTGPADTRQTVWDVARVVAPAADGRELAEIVERIVTANALPSLLVSPGRVLRVPLG